MALVSGTGGAMSSLDFAFVPSPEPDGCELIERKLCEGYGCGQHFYRKRPAMAKGCQDVLCAACKAREMRERGTRSERRTEVIGRTRKFPVLGEQSPDGSGLAQKRGLC